MDEYLDADSREQSQADDYIADLAARQHGEYLKRKWNVFCDCCPRQDYGSRQALEDRGWLLIRGAELCWEHRF